MISSVCFCSRYLWITMSLIRFVSTWLHNHNMKVKVLMKSYSWFLPVFLCDRSHIYHPFLNIFITVWSLLHALGLLLEWSMLSLCLFCMMHEPVFYLLSSRSAFLQASLSMDEAARQTSSHSLSSASTYTSATMRHPGSSQRQHRRTGSVGTVSEHEVNQFKWQMYL